MTSRSRILCLLVLPLVTFSACSPVQEPADGPAPEQTVDRSRFGDPYQVVANYNPADPDLYPYLTGDTLVVRVQYAGGCETHELDVRHEVKADSAFVWLRHDANGDMCEALIHDEIETRLPSSVIDARVIVMLYPDGGPNQVIRG